MQRTTRNAASPKAGLHPRNKHRRRYDFKQLVQTLPALSAHVFVNQYGDRTIDFSDAAAVKALNKALLKHFYAVDHWDIPAGYLCPPIPGRADYIHHLADLLAAANAGKIPKGRGILGLDIGVGANCVYPIIASREYGWRMLGSDIDSRSLESANLIVNTNPCLSRLIECRLQGCQQDIFNGILRPGERVDFTLCNPPFHGSKAEASAGTRQKLNNLSRARGQVRGKRERGRPELNFGGQSNELWCEGGEIAFIRRMIAQSRDFASQCYWFTTLVSKKDNLPAIYRALKRAKACEVKTVKMAQGSKISRFVAWTFLDEQQREEWRQVRWGR